MLIRLAATAAVVLAVGAAVALAGTRTTAAGGLEVCVNDTNGLMRAASTCRAGESPLTLGAGGGDTRVTQEGTFTVPFGETRVGKTLPLTGVTVSGRCDVFTAPAPPEEGANPRIELDAASGTTMDAFGGFGATIAGQTLLLPPAGGVRTSFRRNFGSIGAIVTSNGATATMTIGSGADFDTRTCTFLWQAVEAPN